MSTAGKVLSVLVVLVAIVWVLLTAAVTELNRSGTRAVDALRKQVAKLEVEVRESQQKLQSFKSETHNEQSKSDNDLTERQVAQSLLEKARSLDKETLTRVQLQLADAEAVLTTANTHKDEREAEKVAETKGLADARTEVEALKATRETMLARLTELRDKFRATLKENKSLVERFEKSKRAVAPVSGHHTASVAPVLGE